MKIRGALMRDVDQLVEHGREFWEHTRYSKVDNRPYNEDTVRNLVTWLINGPTGDIMILHEDEIIKGFVLLTYYPLAWDYNIKCAGELAWYIAPELRGGNLGAQLLSHAETLAKIRGCDYIAMISMDHSMDVGSLYEKLGYIKTETTYTKEL